MLRVIGVGAATATLAATVALAGPAHATTYYHFKNPATEMHTKACLTGTVDDNAVFFSTCAAPGAVPPGTKLWATPAVDGGVQIKRFGADECIAIVAGSGTSQPYDVRLRACSAGAGTQKWTRTGDHAWRSVLHPDWCITRDYSNNAASVRECGGPGLMARQIIATESVVET